MAFKSITEQVDNQQNANKLWQHIKNAVVLGQPFLFHLEDGVIVKFDKHQATFYVKTPAQED